MKNKYEIRGDVTVIHVFGNGKWHEALIDTDDFILVSDFPYTWGSKYTMSTGEYYVYGMIKRKWMFLHRWIMEPEDEMVIDHINHNPLDNRRENLRIVQAAENSQNVRKRKDNISGVRGVSWNKKSKSWWARVQVGKKRITIGFFHRIDDAREAIETARATYMPFSDDALTKEPDTDLIRKVRAKLAVNNTSGFKGVTWNKQLRKWNASIQDGKKRKFIGYFTDKIEAANAVKKALDERSLV